MRLLLSTMLAALWFVSTASLSGQEVGKFRLKNGGDPVETRLLAWNFETGVLTMEKADGTTEDVAANELHSADGRLVERILHKQILAGQKDVSTRNTGSRANNFRDVTVDGRKNKVDVLGGVKWYSDETTARQLASGRDGVGDDKPIVWFRVLGDLTGLM